MHAPRYFIVGMLCFNRYSKNHQVFFFYLVESRFIMIATEISIPTGSACTPSDQACSLSPDCECLPLFQRGGDAICVHTLISCTVLAKCNSSMPCNTGTICIVYSRCGGQPVCIPTVLATRSACPPSTGNATNYFQHFAVYAIGRQIVLIRTDHFLSIK